MHSNLQGGRAALAALLLLALGLFAPRFAHSQDPVAPQAPPAGVLVDTVLVRGNQRVSEASVRATAGITAGTSVTATQVQGAIGRLMASGQFDWVDVFFRPTAEARGALVVQVRERPLIAEIEFQGLESLSGGSVRDSAGLRTGVPLEPQKVKVAERLVREMLAKKGIQLVSVDTSLTALPDNRGYRLTLNVREGQRLAIADVDFVGNNAFSDEDLRDAMSLKPEGFLWFRSGKYEREKLQEDLRASLPQFYGSHGYIDFAVVSDTLLVDPASGKARVVITVAEGSQYRLGEFTVQGNSRFPTEELKRVYLTQRRSVLGLPFGGERERESGEEFDQTALDVATEEVQKLYRNEGYLYAQVIPVVDRVPATEPGRQPTVNVTWSVSERSPFYIRRINIAGNSTTHETVIRDRLWVLPGDVYNEDRLLQSYQSVAGLGFFEVPMPFPAISPDPEAGTVDITFIVKEKQTGNINFGTVFGGGYSGRSGGVAGFLGYQQPNLFGQGKQASLRAEYGYGRSTFEAAYTDPALFGTRNSGSVSLFRSGDRYIRFGNGRRLRTGGSVTFGFPVPQLTRTRAYLGYSLSNTEYRSSDEDCTDDQSIFCLPDAMASSLSLSLARDTKNHPLFPTQGTRQSIALEQTGGPLGGDGNFQKLLGSAEWWVPVARLGGGNRPARIAFGLSAQAGSIFGEVGQFPFERFYVGGVQTPFPLRGYQEYTVGPRGYDLRCRTSLRLACLGDSFLTVSGEMAVRLSDMLSVSAFYDAGNVYDDVTEIDPTRLFRGAGLGATLVTPFLGAIGIDAAYGFDREKPGWEIHFKLGQNF